MCTYCFIYINYSALIQGYFFILVSSNKKSYFFLIVTITSTIYFVSAFFSLPWPSSTSKSGQRF